MIETLGLAILLPAAIAAVVYLAVRRVWSGEIAQRYAGPVALAAGFVLAYAAHEPRDQWAPTRNWHWLPYLALAAALVGPIAASSGLRRFERWLLEALICCLAAALLVPYWPRLYPPRPYSVPLLAIYLLVLVRLLENLSARASGTRLLTAFTVSASGVAALIAAFVGLTDAGLAVIAAAALAGCGAAVFLTRESSVSGLGLPFAVLVGGWAYIACIDPPQPLPGLLLAPAAPLALWWRSIRGAGAVAAPGSSRRRAVAAVLIDAAAVGLVVAAAAFFMS